MPPSPGVSGTPEEWLNRAKTEDEFKESYTGR
jgi:hypothetical protein